MTAIDLVLFDLDETLFDHRSASRLGFTAYLTSLGGALAAADGESEWARWWAIEDAYSERYNRGEFDLWGARRGRVREFLEPFGIVLTADPDVDAWFHGYYASYTGHWAAHEDVPACLDALDGIRLGVITNAALETQTRKLIEIGVHDRVEHVVASGELGIAKPDPGIFEHTCDLFGIPAASACYVGDKLRTDALGAARAGLLGVWLDRDGSATEAERAEAAAAGVRIIRTLHELTGVIRSENRA